MLSFYIPKTPLVMNKTLYDYCTKSTKESVRKQIEKYNLEKNKPKINNPLDDNGNDKPEFNFYGFLAILSITTVGFIIYKRLR